MAPCSKTFLPLTIFLIQWADGLYIPEATKTGNSCHYTELRPSPNSCSNFLVCSSRNEYEMSCASMRILPPDEDQQLYFSYENQNCDWPDNVDCSIGSETTKTRTTIATVTTTTLTHKQVRIVGFTQFAMIIEEKASPILLTRIRCCLGNYRCFTI